MQSLKISLSQFAAIHWIRVSDASGSNVSTTMIATRLVPVWPIRTNVQIHVITLIVAVDLAMYKIIKPFVHVRQDT